MTTSIASIEPAAVAPAQVATSSLEQRAPRSREAGFERLLNSLPMPAILLAADRCILARNLAAEIATELLACVRLSYGRVTSFAGPATEPFDRVFVRALNGVAATAVVTVPSGGRRTMWRITLGRLERSELAVEAAVLMLIDPPAVGGSTLTALQRLFGLTAAEARVLALLLDDCRPSEIAEELKISITTVRSHLKALFAKTETRRQSELVALAWSAA